MYAGVKAAMIEQFATLDSYALQQTLWYMGRAALEAYPEIAEIRLVAPNKHHFLVDFSRFDEPNENEVFHADDRPYGLIEASAVREGAPSAGGAWHAYTGLA
jgi:urate oxidase